MDETARLRQFYLRFLLVVGMLWGGMPFLTAPLVNRGMGNSPLAVLTALFGSLSILPACALAFWRRRVACVWLTFASVVLIAGSIATVRSGERLGGWEMVGIAGCIVIALWLDFMELQRWPGALEK